MKYNVTLSNNAKKDFKNLVRIPEKDYKQLQSKIYSLSENPRPIGSIKLKGVFNTYRIRSGDYRIIYEIIDDELKVLVITIGDRKNVYK